MKPKELSDKIDELTLQIRNSTQRELENYMNEILKQMKNMHPINEKYPSLVNKFYRIIVCYSGPKYNYYMNEFLKR